MIEAFDEMKARIPEVLARIPLGDGWRRRALIHRPDRVKEFKASPKIVDLERRINEQALLVIHGKTEAERAQALTNVASGMKYFVELVMREIKGETGEKK